MNGIRIPSRLDDPERMLIWTVDEFVGMIIGLAFGMLVLNGLYGILIGVAIWLGLRRLKSGSSLSVLVRYAFWHGGSDYFGIIASPPPYIRHWVL